VDFDVVDLGRSTKDTLEFSSDTCNDALSVVNMPTLKFKGRFIVKTDRADVMEFFTTLCRFLPDYVGKV
jgi:hypothetical protein